MIIIIITTSSYDDHPTHPYSHPHHHLDAWNKTSRLLVQIPQSTYLKGMLEQQKHGNFLNTIRSYVQSSLIQFSWLNIEEVWTGMNSLIAKPIQSQWQNKYPFHRRRWNIVERVTSWTILDKIKIDWVTFMDSMNSNVFIHCALWSFLSIEWNI